MIIGVENQFYFSLTIGDIEDFLKTEDLAAFILIEQAGNILPTFELTFQSENEKIISRLHEGTDIKIQLGPSRDDFEDIVLTPTKLQIDQKGKGLNLYSMKGFSSNLNYSQSPIKNISNKQSGVATILENTNKYFKNKSNVEVSNDSQYWIQNNIPTRFFINEVWMHSYIRRSFLSCAITANNEFILKDIKKEIADKAEDPDWIFSATETGKNFVNYASDFTLVSKTGLVNSLVGQGRSELVYNIESGESSIVSKEAEALFALTREVAKRADLEKRFLGSNATNDNVHNNYWLAYKQNLTGNISLGAITNIVNLKGDYKNIKPLDIVMFKSPSTNDDKQSQEYFSGAYIVNKTIKTIAGNEFNSAVELCRESMNGVKNVT